MLRKGFKRDFLMFLATLGDWADELSFSTAYKRLYWPGYKPKRVSEEVSRMVKVKEIEREIVGGEPVLKMTARGWKLLDETIPLRKMAQRKWDGVWRMVIFDIKEENRYLRDSLREKLKDLGFGKWQRSVYITPHNILRETNEFLQEKKLYPRCVCLEAKKVGVGDEKELTAYVFKLEELGKKYERILSELEELEEKIKTGQIKGREKALEEFGKIWTTYKAVLLKDPFLPKKLLPQYWLADKVRSELGKSAKLVWKLR